MTKLKSHQKGAPWGTFRSQFCSRPFSVTISDDLYPCVNRVPPKERPKGHMKQSRLVAKWAVSLYKSEVVLKFSVVRNGKIKRWRLRWAYWTVGCGNKLHNSKCQSSDEPSPLYLHQPWSTVLRPKKKSSMYISTFMFIRIKLWGDALCVCCVDGKLQAIDEMFIYRYQWVEYMERLALGTAKVRDRRQLAGIVYTMQTKGWNKVSTIYPDHKFH